MGQFLLLWPRVGQATLIDGRADKFRWVWEHIRPNRHMRLVFGEESVLPPLSSRGIREHHCPARCLCGLPSEIDVGRPTGLRGEDCLIRIVARCATKSRKQSITSCSTVFRQAGMVWCFVQLEHCPLAAQWANDDRSMGLLSTCALGAPEKHPGSLYPCVVGTLEA